MLVGLDCSPRCFKTEKSKGRCSAEVSRASLNAHCVRAATKIPCCLKLLLNLFVKHKSQGGFCWSFTLLFLTGAHKPVWL